MKSGIRSILWGRGRRGKRDNGEIGAERKRGRVWGDKGRSGLERDFSVRGGAASYTGKMV